MKKNKLNHKISRKEAGKKMLKYSSLIALGTYSILNPLKAAQSSTEPTPPPFDPGSGF